MSLQIHKISDTLYQFNESTDYGDGKPRPYVDSYLLIGKERAALVDTLQKVTGLYAEVRKLTDLPVDVLITHGHGDHVGASTPEFAEAGCKIYMDKKDFEFLSRMDFVKPEWFTELNDGDIFDLGGYKLETIACGGHTKGCVAFVERQAQMMFSGDTIGSGSFWMQLPGCLPMMVFKMNVTRLYDKVKDLKDLLVYPGHRNQSPVQLTLQYVKDCCTVATRLTNGTLVGEDKILDLPGRHMEFKTVSHGQMLDFCYDPDNLRFSNKLDPKLEAVKDKFVPDATRDGSRMMEYLKFTPETEPGKTYPLVIYLHGAGERGDNLRLVLANTGATKFASDEWQEKHPCFVVAPQVATGEWWSDDHYQAMIAKLAMTLPIGLPIDKNRIYITGLSMGGMGTWRAISKNPQLFAAAMPICGAGDPFMVRAAKDVPVWAFHAEDDPTVPVGGYFPGDRFPGMTGTRTMVNSLRGAGNPNVRYTEYPTGWLGARGIFAHGSWIPAYENDEALEWIFSQTKQNRYEIHWIMPGFYWIEDNTDSSLYLIEGKDKALVVDTGMGDNDFMGMIQSLTRLPVELAVTHNHGDHMYHLDKFDRYYMSEKDMAMFDEPFMKDMLGERDFSKAQLIPIVDGDIIDLGGGYEVEVFNLGGHTPGSVVFLDKKRKIALTGDALGVWMQVPGATDISYYLGQLENFLARMSAPEYEGVVMMNGHRKQEGGYPPYGDKYVPNDLQKVRDMITVCKKVLAEEIEFAPYPIGNFGKPAFVATYGQASLVFTEDRVK